MAENESKTSRDETAGLAARAAKLLAGPVGLALFGLAAFGILAAFSGHRFLHQSRAPHFIWQAMAFLHGSLSLVDDPPNLEDWVRLGGQWFVSFPAFPALVMVPFAALFGYAFNDTSFTVAAAALSLTAFLALLRRLCGMGVMEMDARTRCFWTAVLGFGTLFFYCAIRGEVWFTAEVMGVGLTSLFLLCAVGARHPVLAGLFYSMATLTRTPLAFAAVFFVAEVVFPEGRFSWAALKEDRRGKLRKLLLFAAGALPLAAAHMAFNYARFGSVTEFGHSLFWNNRVNADIARWGLFNVHYLGRNLQAAFLKFPRLSLSPFRLGYDPHGMSLFITTPLFLLLFWPKGRTRLTLALWCAALAVALPGLFYQNDGYMQFGFRFSLDYTPFLILLVAMKARTVRAPLVIALAAAGLAVNTWGAVAFHGYSW